MCPSLCTPAALNASANLLPHVPSVPVFGRVLLLSIPEDIRRAVAECGQHFLCYVLRDGDVKRLAGLSALADYFVQVLALVKV